MKWTVYARKWNCFYRYEYLQISISEEVVFIPSSATSINVRDPSLIYIVTVNDLDLCANIEQFQIQL